MCFKIQAARGFSCEIFQAVDRESDIWELGTHNATDHGDLEAVD